MNNGLQEESWAAVEAEAEMNYDSRPSLLPDLKKLKAAGESEDKFSELDSSAKKDPRAKDLWNRLPEVGPYRIMLTNLPKGIAQDTLESELSQHKITAKIEKKAENRYCYLVFQDKKHCLECVNLYGLQIQSCLVQLKITKTEQQAEIRRSNTSRGSASRTSNVASTARFKNLSGRTGRGETTKHRHPVGGSIRKKRSNRSNQSSSQSKPQVNPWTDSNKFGQQPKLLSRSNRQSQNRFGPTGVSSRGNSSISRRNDDGGLGRSPNNRREDRRDDNRRDFSRRDDNYSRRNDDRDNFSRRDNSDRASFRDRGNDRNERRFGGDRADRSDDDRGNFRNLNKGRKLREEDGRADADMSWRRGGAKAVTRKSPRDNIPATKSDKKPTERSRVSRGDPARLDPDYSRTQNSTQQRRTTQLKKEQEEKLAAKKKSTNKFAALFDEEDD